MKMQPTASESENSLNQVIHIFKKNSMFRRSDGRNPRSVEEVEERGGEATAVATASCVVHIKRSALCSSSAKSVILAHFSFSCAQIKAVFRQIPSKMLNA